MQLLPDLCKQLWNMIQLMEEICRDDQIVFSICCSTQLSVFRHLYHRYRIRHSSSLDHFFYIIQKCKRCICYRDLVILRGQRSKQRPIRYRRSRSKNENFGFLPLPRHLLGKQLRSLN